MNIESSKFVWYLLKMDGIEEEEKQLDVQLEEVALLFTPRPDRKPRPLPPTRDLKYRSYIPRPIVPTNPTLAERSRSLSASGMSERPMPTGNRPPVGLGLLNTQKDRPYSDQGQRQLRFTKHNERPKSPEVTSRPAWET